MFDRFVCDHLCDDLCCQRSFCRGLAVSRRSRMGRAGCLQGRMVDALADSTDEGRLRLRYASGSRQQGFDPRISEWGNPRAGTAFARGVRREVKHLSTCRKGCSVSSGERKRIRPNRARVTGASRCARGVEGACVRVLAGPAGVIKRRVRRTGLNAGPQRVMAP